MFTYETFKIVDFGFGCPDSMLMMLPKHTTDSFNPQKFCLCRANDKKDIEICRENIGKDHQKPVLKVHRRAITSSQLDCRPEWNLDPMQFPVCTNPCFDDRSIFNKVGDKLETEN